MVDTVRASTQRRGIYVMDRGFDRAELLHPLLDRKLRFIVRLVGDRHLIGRHGAQRASEMGRTCAMRYAETVIKEGLDTEKKLPLEFGCVPVKLPERPEQLYLVVVRGFGEEPMLLLTDMALTPSRKSLWAIVRGYLCRWLVEETIRFIKQSCHLEDMRVLRCETLAQPDGLGAGRRLLRRHVAGRIHQAGRADHSHRPDRQAVLRRPGLPLLRLGLRHRHALFPPGPMEAPAQTTAQPRRWGPIGLVLSLCLKTGDCPESGGLASAGERGV